MVDVDVEVPFDSGRIVPNTRGLFPFSVALPKFERNRRDYCVPRILIEALELFENSVDHAFNLEKCMFTSNLNPSCHFLVCV